MVAERLQKVAELNLMCSFANVLLHSSGVSLPRLKNQSQPGLGQGQFAMHHRLTTTLSPFPGSQR